MKTATFLVATLPALAVHAQTAKPADPSARVLLVPTSAEYLASRGGGSVDKRKP